MEETKPYILIVDDDLEDCRIISQTINEFGGVNTQTLNHGAELVSFLDKKSDLPALIILDYNMPVVTGEQVLITLKKHDNYKQIPVIPYSTHMSTKMRKNLITLGAYDCYFKPSNYDMLVQQAKIFANLATFFANK